MFRRLLSRWALLGWVALVLAGAVSGLLSPCAAAITFLVGTAILSIGVFFPGTRMYAEWQSRVRDGCIALTFDDGPHPDTTRRVLALLAEHGQRATFFVIGRKVEAHPEVARDLVRQGHAIGIHSFEHPWLYALLPPQRVLSDIRRCQEAVRRATGVTPTLFRPPVGLLSPFTAEAARRARVSLVGWSARAFDGVSRRKPEQVLRTLTKKLRESDIVLLHDASEADGSVPAGVEALPAILELMRERGLSSVALHGDEISEPSSPVEVPA